MTTIEHNIAHVLQSPRLAVEVRWSCTVTRWIDRFGLITNGQRVGRVELVVSLTRDAADESRCTIAAWLTMGERHVAVLEPTPGRCTTMLDGDLLHTDITIESERDHCVLALTCRSEDLVFAQSPLLRQAGFSGGSYDPPVMIASSKCSVVRVR